MKLTNKDLRIWYSDFRKRYFGKRIPRVLLVQFGKIKPLGRTSFRHLCGCEECNRLKDKYKSEVKTDRLPIEIIISEDLRSEFNQAITTLIHEMIHVSIGGRYKHGHIFYREMKRIFNLGAYRGIL